MAKKNISPNRERMYAYAKGGGLQGFQNGGDVLPKAQLGAGVKAIIKAVKKAVPKIKKMYTDYKGTTFDADMLENTGYARQVDLDRAIKNRKKATGSN
tara:strand:- start:42 stop:335 length:294 start_codon:yes stop_codon:yes gene_type:complete